MSAAAYCRDLDATRFLTNKGTIGALQVNNVYAKAEGSQTRGAVVSSPGLIRQHALQNVSAVNVDPGLTK